MSNYEIEVLVNGRPIKTFNHKGAMFVEGRKGSNFELKFINNTWSRVEVVPSVDGLSVMDGEECGVHSSGYLVPARESIVIPGWRLNNSDVAKFVFSGKEKSYAAKSGGDTENVGAIGFMVFKEKQMSIFQPTPWQPYYSHEFGRGYGDVRHGSDWLTVSTAADNQERFRVTSNSIARGMASTTVTSTESLENSSSDVQWNLGVGFGDETSHKVNEVTFYRETPEVPTDMLVVYYDSRKGLESRGIQVIRSKKKKTSQLPNPFPTYSQPGCTPPPGWKPKKYY